MNGDGRMVSTKELLRSMNREISDKTGIPEKELANMSPMEFDRRLGVTKPDIEGTIEQVNARIQREREWVDRNLRKVLSEYYKQCSREKVKDYYR